MNSSDPFRSLSLQVARQLCRLARITPSCPDAGPCFVYLSAASRALDAFERFKEAAAAQNLTDAQTQAGMLQDILDRYRTENPCADPDAGGQSADETFPLLGCRYLLAAESYARQKETTRDEAIVSLVEDFLDRWEKDQPFAPIEELPRAARLFKLAQEAAYLVPAPGDLAGCLQYLQAADTFLNHPVLSFYRDVLPKQPDAKLCAEGPLAEQALAEQAEKELSALLASLRNCGRFANALEQEEDIYFRTFPLHLHRLAAYARQKTGGGLFRLTDVIEDILGLALGDLLCPDDETARAAAQAALDARLQELCRPAEQYLVRYAYSVPECGSEDRVLSYIWTAGSVMAMYAAFEKAAAEQDFAAMEEALKNMELYDRGYAEEGGLLFSSRRPPFAPESGQLYWLGRPCLQAVAAYSAQTGMDFAAAFTSLLENGLAKTAPAGPETGCENEPIPGISALVEEVYGLLRRFAYLCPPTQKQEDCCRYLYAAAQLAMCYGFDQAGFAAAVNYDGSLEKATAEKNKMEAIFSRYAQSALPLNWLEQEETLFAPLFPQLMERLKTAAGADLSVGPTLTRTIEHLVSPA